jgi:hypothetical protein
MLLHWCYVCKRCRFLYDIENIELRHWYLDERNNVTTQISYRLAKGEETQ